MKKRIYWRSNYDEYTGPLTYLDVNVNTFRSSVAGFSRNTALTEEEVLLLKPVRMDADFSDPDAEGKIYAWLDGNMINWWSNAESTYLTDESNLMFRYMCSAAFIDVSGIDVSEITKMDQMFFMCRSLMLLKGAEEWDVSNVETMAYMFYGCEKLPTLYGMAGWNVCKVKEFGSMFSNCSSLRDTSATENWGISSDADKRDMYKNCPGAVKTASSAKQIPFGTRKQEIRNLKHAGGYNVEITIETDNAEEARELLNNLDLPNGSKVRLKKIV